MFKNKELNSNDKLYKHLQEHIEDYEIIMRNEKFIGRNKIGTEVYMPLESLLHLEIQSYEVDIWSIGVIIFQILTKKYNVFHNITFMRKISCKNKKNNHLISFILELGLLFGTKYIAQILDRLGFFFLFFE